MVVHSATPGSGPYLPPTVRPLSKRPASGLEYREPSLARASESRWGELCRPCRIFASRIFSVADGAQKTIDEHILRFARALQNVEGHQILRVASLQNNREPSIFETKAKVVVTALD